MIHTFAELFENWVLVNKIVSEIHRCLFSDENLHCITQQSQPIYPCAILFFLNSKFLSFPGGLVIKSLFADGGDMGSIPGLRESDMPDSN